MFSHWTQTDIVVNGVKIHYTRTGYGDKHPIVLVHGFSDNGLCWTPVARELEADYDVIMPDMRGHGLSERVGADGDVDMPADVAELIGALGLDRPVVCGHSMGAGITYHIGVRFPKLARALVLEDPPFRESWPEQPTGEAGENPIVKWARTLPGRNLDDLLVEYRREHPTWPEELVRPMCEAKKQLDPMVAETMSSRIRRDSSSWLETLPQIKLPMLVFTANPELGAIVTPESAARARELKPDMDLVHIPDVGHLIRFDSFATFMQALRDFLKKIDY